MIGGETARNKRTELLPFHLPKEEVIVFTEDNGYPTKETKSKFTAWMECNSLHPKARNLRYGEFPSEWTWHQGIKAWRPRLRKANKEYRIVNVPEQIGEAYYLRRLLDVVRGPKNFEDIRTVQGVIYNTFKAAYDALEPIAEDNMDGGQ